MSLEALRREIGAVNDLLCAASILVWDSRTVMPPGGVEARGYQIATLMESARERLLGTATRKALDGAEAAVQHAPEDSAESREVAAVRDAVAFHSRIPADLIRRKAELRPKANVSWIEARAKNDLTIFAPHLAETVDLQKAYAEAIRLRPAPLRRAPCPSTTGRGRSPASEPLFEAPSGLREIRRRCRTERAGRGATSCPFVSGGGAAGASERRSPNVSATTSAGGVSTSRSIPFRDLLHPQ
jgi:hypothetical protein